MIKNISTYLIIVLGLTAIQTTDLFAQTADVSGHAKLFQHRIKIRSL